MPSDEFNHDEYILINIIYKDDAYYAVRWWLDHSYDILADPWFQSHMPVSFTMLDSLKEGTDFKVDGETIIFKHDPIMNIWRYCSQEKHEDSASWMYQMLIAIEVGHEWWHPFGLKNEKKKRRYTISKQRWLQFKRINHPNYECGQISEEADDFNHQAVYLLQAYADRDTSKYKIGMASNLMQRMKTPEYRNASIIITMRVTDAAACERELIHVFDALFKKIKSDKRGNYGNEWYEGDLSRMRSFFISVADQFQ